MSSESATAQQPRRHSAVAMLLVISGKLLKLMKVVKALKVLKPMITFATMALSAVCYSGNLGLLFGAGFVGLVFCHEMGHVLALKARGMRASAPVFIPFLGALVLAPSIQDDPENEAFVGIAGPVAGGIATGLLCACMTVANWHPVALVAAAYFSTLINLFNLIPARPLDGGRVLQIVSRWSSFIGLGLGLVGVLLLRDVSLLVIFTLIIIELPVDQRLTRWGTLFCAVVFHVVWILGGSIQPAWLNVMDSFVILLFGAIPWVKSYQVEGPLQMPSPPEAYWNITSRRRMVWLGRYIVLVLALLALFVWQTHTMPIHHPAKESVGKVS